jgi:hypothetical protein
VFVNLSRAPAAAYPAVATRSAGRSSFVVGSRSIYGGTTRFVDLCKQDDVAHESGARLVVDNTFTSMIMSPLRYGADVVVQA